MDEACRGGMPWRDVERTWTGRGRRPGHLGGISGAFHGVGEWVPGDSFRYGIEVLDRFLDYC
jgi:hypothetical protein